MIGLKEKADDRVKKLSGGQQRRLDCRPWSLSATPSCSSWTSPLPVSTRRPARLVGPDRRLASAGTTVLLTTHYMDEVEALADRVAVLSNGEIVASGTPTSIGGRDSGAVTIRFMMPEGVIESDVPRR